MWQGVDEHHQDEVNKFVFRLGRCPHDWLFPRMAAVIHHGGAGTVAAGLKAGRPTLVCPFFGDQYFWGRAIEVKPPKRKRMCPALSAWRFASM